MSIKVIGKSVLGELGFCQVPSKMGDHLDEQLSKITSSLPIPSEISSVAMTSMTGSEEINLTDGCYFPKIREYNDDIYPFMMPKLIYNGCKTGLDKLRPGCDFIIWDSKKVSLAVTTFSREAPIIAFESLNGKKALGVILRPSLMKFGDYLFKTISDYLGEAITVTLVTCNHYEYPEGSIPTIIQNLALKYKMNCVIAINSEKDPDCYHRGEKGNHVVAMW